MLPKPEGCSGCPLYTSKTRFGFVDDSISSTARVVLCYDKPAGNFGGDTAAETAETAWFRRNLADYLGLQPYEVGFMHLIRCKHSAGKKGKDLAQAKLHCRTHDGLREDQLLVAMGPDGWKHFSNHVGGSRPDWRSYFVEVDYDAVCGDGDDSGVDLPGDDDADSGGS